MKPVTFGARLELQATAATGLLVNYNLHATRTSSGDMTLNAFNELRLFGPFGVISNTRITRSGDSGGWHTNTVRLDTYWQSFVVEHMVTVTVGDSFTGALPWTRATRIGGITISRDFSLQPYRSTVPLQSFVGKVVTPSRIELYINDIRRFSGQVPAGPFELTVSPNVTGTAYAQLLVVNALGQTKTINYRFYSGGSLLRPGLADWSVSLGSRGGTMASNPSIMPTNRYSAVSFATV